MDQIRANIKCLYPDQSKSVMISIAVLLSKYQSLFSPENHGFQVNDIILITYAESFKNVSESGLQTLNKVCKKYLSGSINSIHILPFYPSTSDDGFSVTDYKKVNPKYGNWDDIRKIGESFHLMFDAVINHISKSSGWFIYYLNGDTEFDDFFIEGDPRNAELAKVIRPRTSPLLHTYIRKGEEINIWTTFSEDQVDLNYSNPKVFLKVLDVLLFYISKGAKFIRLDAIAFLWKTIGTNCLHLDETHLVVQTYRRIIERIAPHTVLITETNVPHAENISYFGTGCNEAHMVYNFSLPPLLAYSLLNENIEVLTRWANSLRLPSGQCCFFNFTASHDGIGLRPLQGLISDEAIRELAKTAIRNGGFVSSKSNADGTTSPYEINCNYLDLLTVPNAENQLRAKRFMLTQSVMLCMPGVPGIYYHSLFGSGNDRQGAINSGINRRINREKIQFAVLENELQTSGNIRQLVFQQYTDLLQLRKQEAAFHPTGKARFTNDEGVFVIERIYDNETIVCLHNFSGKQKDISKYTDNKLCLTNNNPNKNIPEPYGFEWFK